jgi:hypothetical protein
MQLPTQQQDTPAAATAACGTVAALLILYSLCLTYPLSFLFPSLTPPRPPLVHHITTTPPAPATHLDTVKGCSANHSPGVINKVLREAPVEKMGGVNVAVG